MPRDEASHSPFNLGEIEEFSSVLDNAPVGVHFVDKDGTILWANRSELEFLGYSAEEYIGRNIRDFHIDQEAITEALDTLLSGGSLSGFRVTLRHKDGTPRYGSVSSNVRMKDGKYFHSRCFTRDITESTLAQIKTAEELRAKEERLRLIDTIFDAMVDFAYCLDREGRFQFVNKSLLDLWGLNFDEAIGKNFYDLDYPEDLADKLHRQIDEVFETGKSVKDVTPYTSPTGVEGTYEYIFHPVFADDGSVQNIVGSTRDISSHKETEERLRETQRVLRLAMISSRMGAWARDVELDKDFWTPELEAIFGLEAGSFDGSDNGFFSYVHEDDRQRVAAEIDLAVHERREYVTEFRFLHASGQVRWMEGRGQGVYTEDGRPVKLYGIGIDITDRKLAEERLKESEGNLRTLANSIPQLAWMAGADGNIFWYNEQWFKYTGTDLDQMRGFGWRSVHDPELLPEVMEKWMHSLQTGEKFEMEFPLRGADGKYRWFLTQAHPLRNSEGTITRWFGTNTDIQELWEIRQKTEAASRAKDDFLAMLSHELRAPLNVMSGWSQILRRSEYDEEKVKKGVEIILRNVELQNSLIEDLLDVSRIVTGKIRLETSPILLNSLVQACYDANQANADSAGLEMTLTVDTEPVILLGDEHRLEQIINNLISNAIKFTPKGGKIDVTLVPQGESARLTIKDSGIGISPELLPHIFERFSQADTTSTRQFGGLGLGLAIVDHLVRLHGGKVTAESEGEGTGATFTVELPLVASPDARPSGKSKRLSSSGNRDNSLEGVRILIVDDDADARTLMATFLESEGALVVPASSAKDGLDRADSETFDILISDLGMPQMDGYEFIRRLREKIKLNQLPAIALTGYVADRDRDLVFASGFQSHLPKPVDFDDLRSNIKGLLKLNRDLN